LTRPRLAAFEVFPEALTPREWQARYGAVVADRRSYVLQQLVGKLRE